MPHTWVSNCAKYVLYPNINALDEFKKTVSKTIPSLEFFKTFRNPETGTDDFLEYNIHRIWCNGLVGKFITFLI